MAEIAQQDPKDARSVEVDISKWRMRDRITFTEIATRNDSESIDYLIEKGVITRWSFEGSPADRDAWLNLELEDFSFALRAVLSAAQERFQKGF